MIKNDLKIIRLSRFFFFNIRKTFEFLSKEEKFLICLCLSSLLIDIMEKNKNQKEMELKIMINGLKKDDKNLGDWDLKIKFDFSLMNENFIKNISNTDYHYARKFNNILSLIKKNLKNNDMESNNNIQNIIENFSFYFMLKYLKNYEILQNIIFYTKYVIISIERKNF